MSLFYKRKRFDDPVKAEEQEIEEEEEVSTSSFPLLEELLSLNIDAIQAEAAKVNEEMLERVYQHVQQIKGIMDQLQQQQQLRLKLTTSSVATTTSDDEDDDDSSSSSSVQDALLLQPPKTQETMPEMGPILPPDFEVMEIEVQDHIIPEKESIASLANTHSTASSSSTTTITTPTTTIIPTTTMMRDVVHYTHITPESMVDTVMPAEMLRLLVITGFLSAEELGRLLLLTSRAFVAQLGEEFCWEMICKCKWNNASRVPPSFLQNRGYHWFFTQMSQGEITEDRPGLAEPTLQPENLKILISVRDQSNLEVYADILDPSAVEEWIQKGTVTIPFEEPIVIGQLTKGQINTDPYLMDPCRSWSASVDLLRLDTNQSCCIHDSDDVDYDIIDHWITGDDDDDDDDDDVDEYGSRWVGQLDFTPQFSRLELTDEGLKLERRIQLGDFFRHDVDGSGYQGFRVHISLLCYRCEAPDDPHHRMVQYQFQEAQLKVSQVDVDYRPTELLTGPLLLHMLNELLGWDG